MRTKTVAFGAVLGLMMGLMGCAKGAAVQGASSPTAASPDGKPIATDGPKPVESSYEPPANKNGQWIGASAESEMLMAGTTETMLGVWVDVPNAAPAVRPAMDVAIVVDTSGSMAGPKIESARSAARMMVQNLKDGDIVSLDTFNDMARTVVPPTTLDFESRERVLRAIAMLGTGGGTNMFAGLSNGESHMSMAPQTHAVRRIVMISDGIANVGPSTPESLGRLAEQGLRNRAQVTSLGVGTDYDENTLNALSIRSSGRIFHISQPVEMQAVLRKEIDLLNSTLASDAFIEVVPTPGVQLVAAEGIRSDWAGGGALRIPLGALHAGQHREALVRVRVSPATLEAMGGSSSKALASVRLHFRDPSDADLERVQEVVARAGTTSDPAIAARMENARTKAIAAIQEAALIQRRAAQQVNQGQFMDADKELAAAQARLDDAASKTKDEAQKKRLSAQSQALGGARATTQAMPSAPPAAKRDHALKMNEASMKAQGF
jgi:Ca-activated chloride channel family protein